MLAAGVLFQFAARGAGVRKGVCRVVEGTDTGTVVPPHATATGAGVGVPTGRNALVAGHRLDGDTQGNC